MVEASRWERSEVADRLLVALPLLACGAFPLGLLALRIRATGELSYDFLAWNLFLAALPVPLAFAAEAAARAARNVAAVVLGAAWLVFFPNAPYLVTDLVHLRERPPTPLWFDALILVSAGVAGLLAAFVSLHVVQLAISRRFGERVGWVAALMVLGLSGFGVYLGRFARFNSWDVLARPRTLLYDVRNTVIEPAGRGGAVAVTALFASFLVVVYVTIEMLARVRPRR